MLVVDAVSPVSYPAPRDSSARFRCCLLLPYAALHGLELVFGHSLARCEVSCRKRKKKVCQNEVKKTQAAKSPYRQ